MNKYEIVSKIEKIAPLDTQEKWDCSGWGINVGIGVNKFSESVNSTSSHEGAGVNRFGGNVSSTNLNEGAVEVLSEEVNKIMFTLTVTDDVVKQARLKGVI